MKMKHKPCLALLLSLSCLSSVAVTTAFVQHQQHQQQQQQQQRPLVSLRNAYGDDYYSNGDPNGRFMRSDGPTNGGGGGGGGGLLRPDQPGGYTNNGNHYHDEPNNDNIAVHLSSDGARPMYANVQEWRTSGHTPFSVNTYSQNAQTRRFQMESPTRDGSPHSMAIRNTGPIEFPLAEQANHQHYTLNQGNTQNNLIQGGGSLRTYNYDQYYNHQNSNNNNNNYPSIPDGGDIIQGEGMVKTWPIQHHTEQVRIVLSSDAGYDINARIEVLQGPNCIMQEFEVYSEDGRRKPFGVLVDTPGYGSTIRIQNTGPMTYPIRAFVEPLAAVRSNSNDGYGAEAAMPQRQPRRQQQPRQVQRQQQQPRQVQRQLPAPAMQQPMVQPNSRQRVGAAAGGGDRQRLINTGDSHFVIR